MPFSLLCVTGPSQAELESHCGPLLWTGEPSLGTKAPGRMGGYVCDLWGKAEEEGREGRVHSTGNDLFSQRWQRGCGGPQRE